MKDFDEMRNIDIELDYKPKSKPKKEKKGGFLSKFVAWLLGLIIGILGALGGAAFFGWYVVAKMPIENSSDKVNKLLGADIDYTQYIDASYGEKTIATLVGDTLSAMQAISAGEGTLNSLNAISPLVGDMIHGEDGTGGLIEGFALYAITVDSAELMNRILVKPEGTPDAEENKDVYFADYLVSCINQAPLGDMLTAFGYETNDVIRNLCYGVENVDYVYTPTGEITMINGAQKLTVEEFLSEDLNEQIRTLPIDSFVSIQFPDDALMCTLAYGPEYRYEKELDEDGNIVMKQVFYEYSLDEENNFVLQDDEGNDVTANILSGEPTSPITLKHVLQQGDEETEEITETRYLLYSATDNRYYAFTDEEYTKPIKFQKNTIGDLSDGSSGLIDKMYVKDLLNVDETDERVMIALCYGKEDTDWQYDENGKIQMLNGAKPRTVKELKEGNLINKLTLKDLLGEDVENNKILSNLADSSIDSLAKDMESLTFKDVFADKIYTDSTYTQIKPMWKYLFDNPATEEIEGPDQYYLLGQTSDSTAEKLGVDNMIDNMQQNMQTSKLKDLIEDDLIVFEDDPSTPENEAETDKQKFLTDNTQKKITINGEDKFVRDLTIIEMINWALMPIP